MWEEGKGSNRDICVTASSELLALLLNDNVMLKLSLQSYLKVVSELLLLASAIHVVLCILAVFKLDMEAILFVSFTA